MRFSIWLFPVLAPILFGCASTVDVKSYTAQAVRDGTTITLQEDEVIIFGRILFIENGRSLVPYGFQTRPWWWLSCTVPPESATGKPGRLWTLSPRTRDDGTFIYVIPSGRHEIMHLSPFYYMPLILPALEFEVSTPGVAYYLGDLEVDYDATRWLGGLWGNHIKNLNYLEVVDRYDEARARLSATLGDTTGMPVQKALMTRIHGQVPGLDEPGGAIFMGSPGTFKFGN
jgi:hypothetical protein